MGYKLSLRNRSRSIRTSVQYNVAFRMLWLVDEAGAFTRLPSSVCRMQQVLSHLSRFPERYYSILALVLVCARIYTCKSYIQYLRMDLCRKEELPEAILYQRVNWSLRPSCLSRSLEKRACSDSLSPTHIIGRRVTLCMYVILKVQKPYRWCLCWSLLSFSETWCSGPLNR